MPRTQREARGTQFGNKRGKERQRRRSDLRKADPRYQRAMAEAADAERKFESMKRSDGPAEGAAYQGTTAAILASLESPTVLPVQKSSPRCGEPGHVPCGRCRPDLFGPVGQGRPKLPDLIDPRATPDPEVWSLGQARSMLRQGYRIDHVIKTTGWGPVWFDDLALDEDGYGLPLDDQIEHLSRRR